MLLTTYTDANKSTSTGLTIRYAVQWVKYSYYRITRTARKSYAYIGMTRDAANACSASKIAQYTRSHKSESEETNEQTGMPVIESTSSLMANISVSHDTGDMWVCNIDVDETDVAVSPVAPTDPSSFFTTENAWNYDETSALGLTASSVTSAESERVIGYSQTIDDFDAQRIMAEHKAATASSWTRLRPSSVTGSTVTVSAATPSGTVWRLAYGKIASNTITQE